MRPFVLATLALALVAPMFAGALPLGPTVSLDGPSRVGTNETYTVRGEVVLAGYAPMGAVNVSLYQDGRYLGSVGTMLGGTYRLDVKAPAEAGPIQLVAKAFQGTTLRAESAPLAITVYPPPEPPAQLSATPDAITSSARIEWTASPETHGDLDAYVVWRRVDGSAWGKAHEARPVDRAWEDPVPTWGQLVEYRVTGFSNAGHGAPSPSAPIAFPPSPWTSPAEVGVPYVYVCDPATANTCDLATPGNYTLLLASVRFDVFVQGTLRDHEGNGVPHATHDAHVEARFSCHRCESAPATQTRAVTTWSSGFFAKKFDGVLSWENVQPGECRTVVFDALGFDSIIIANGDAGYQFCY